jgi:hypothetical protein
MARRIAKSSYVTAAAAWQKKKLEEVNGLYKTLRTNIKSALNEAHFELEELFVESVNKSVENDNKIFNKVGNKVASKAGSKATSNKVADKVADIENGTEALRNVMRAGFVQTKGALANFCNSAGRVAIGKFSEYIDVAYMQVASGAFSREQAISKAVSSLAREGIHSVEYISGRNISIEAGVRRAVVTGINKTNCEISIGRAAELGATLVKTTAHLGARPEHEVWQGQVFSLNGSGEYENFYEATGYGEVDGLGGANCRHSFYPFSREYEDLPEGDSPESELIGQKENEEMYKLEAEQRYNERMIREWKRRADVMEAGEQGNGYETGKVKEWQARQREFVLKNDLARQYLREKVYS